MSNGKFEIDDDDIVCLQSDGDTPARSGWVNVGVHAVKLQLSAGGDLLITVHARENETLDLATASVSKATALAGGGVDPDASEEGEESKCGVCSATVSSIVGCPDGTEICHARFENGAH